MSYGYDDHYNNGISFADLTDQGGFSGKNECKAPVCLMVVGSSEITDLSCAFYRE